MVEMTVAAVRGAARSAWSLLLSTVIVAYLGLSTGSKFAACVCLAIGTVGSLWRRSIYPRYIRRVRTHRLERSRAHIEVVLSTLLSAVMWPIAILAIFPHLSGDSATVFLMILVAAMSIGASFMSMAPPSYLIYVPVLIGALVIERLSHHEPTTLPLVVLMVLFGVAMIRISFEINTSAYRFARKLARLNVAAHLQKLNLMQTVDENNRRAQTTLKASAEARSLFLAKLSHEFRSPLQVLVASADLISHYAATEGSKPIRDAAHHMETAAQQLMTQADDLSNYLRTSSTSIRLKNDSVNLPMLLSDAAGMFQPMARAKSISLEFVPGASDAESLVVDSQRLQQILTNLISNAIKYTESGSVALSCRTLPDSRVEVTVADTGIGIPADIQASIFEPWYRAEVSSSQIGLGLGLPIVRALCDAIGANITIKSSVGVGTVATVVLPAKPTQQSPDYPQSTSD